MAIAAVSSKQSANARQRRAQEGHVVLLFRIVSPEEGRNTNETSSYNICIRSLLGQFTRCRPTILLTLRSCPTTETLPLYSRRTTRAITPGTQTRRMCLWQQKPEVKLLQRTTAKLDRVILNTRHSLRTSEERLSRQRGMFVRPCWE